MVSFFFPVFSMFFNNVCMACLVGWCLWAYVCFRFIIFPFQIQMRVFLSMFLFYDLKYVPSFSPGLKCLLWGVSSESDGCSPVCYLILLECQIHSLSLSLSLCSAEGGLSMMCWGQFCLGFSDLSAFGFPLCSQCLWRSLKFRWIYISCFSCHTFRNSCHAYVCSDCVFLNEVFSGSEILSSALLLLLVRLPIFFICFIMFFSSSISLWFCFKACGSFGIYSLHLFLCFLLSLKSFIMIFKTIPCLGNPKGLHPVTLSLGWFSTHFLGNPGFAHLCFFCHLCALSLSSAGFLFR